MTIPTYRNVLVLTDKSSGYTIGMLQAADLIIKVETRKIGKSGLTIIRYTRSKDRYVSEKTPLHMSDLLKIVEKAEAFKVF